MKRRSWIGLAAALVLVVALGALVVSLVRLRQEYRSPLYDLYESVKAGMSEAEVRDVLPERRTGGPDPRC